MAYSDRARRELFNPKVNRQGIFSGVFSKGKKKSVTYIDPQGVTRTADTEPKSGRIVPKGSEGKSFVRKRDITTGGNIVGGKLKKQGVFGGVKKFSAPKANVVKISKPPTAPQRPAHSAGSSRADDPQKITVTPPAIKDDNLGPAVIGGAIAGGGATYLFSKMHKRLEDTPTVKANRVPKVASVSTKAGVTQLSKNLQMAGLAKALTSSVVKGTDPEKAVAAQTTVAKPGRRGARKSVDKLLSDLSNATKVPPVGATVARGSKSPGVVVGHAGKIPVVRIPSTEELQHETVARILKERETKGTTAHQEGSSKPAGKDIKVRGATVRVSHKATGASVQTKAQIPVVAAKGVEQKPKVASPTPAQPQSATESGKPQATTLSKSHMEKLRESRRQMIAEGKLEGTTTTQQSSTPTVIKRPAPPKPATPQPDVNAPSRALESPTKGGIDPSVMKKDGTVGTKKLEGTRAILRKGGAARTKPVGAGIPLPVTTIPSRTHPVSAAEVSGARTEYATSSTRNRPGKINESAMDAVARFNKARAKLAAEAPETHEEVPKTALRKTKREKSMREQAGSGPTRIPPGRAAELKDRKAQIEAHMKAKGYTKVEGSGEEAKAVKVAPTQQAAGKAVTLKPVAAIPSPAKPAPSKLKKPKVQGTTKPPTEVKVEAPKNVGKGEMYAPEANRIMQDIQARKAHGRMWWRNIPKGALKGLALPGLMGLDVADRTINAPKGQKAQEARSAAKEAGAIGLGIAALEKVAPTIARGAMRALLPVGLAVTAYDTYGRVKEAGVQGRELFRGLQHKRRTAKYSREKYGTVEAATRTRHSRNKK